VMRGICSAFHSGSQAAIISLAHDIFSLRYMEVAG